LVADNNRLKIFTPGRIGSLQLRNRTIRSGCFEGLSPRGEPTDVLIEHHRRDGDHWHRLHGANPGLKGKKWSMYD
jgi:hypothetical protein